VTDACPHAVSAGSFLLGMLTAEETDEFWQHSTRCSHCREELVELMPGALYLRQLRADIFAAGQRSCTDRPFLSTVVAREPRWIAGCGTC